MTRPLIIVLAALALPLAGCGGGAAPLPVSNGKGPAPYDPGVPYAPRVTPVDLQTGVTNTLLPMPVGSRRVYSGAGERIEVTVETASFQVWGVAATVVKDIAFKNGAKVEETLDWYAQDAAGNVWYLGEDSKVIANGQVVSTEGSWTSGVNNALPGVVMLKTPAVDDVYRQEYLVGEAEDVGHVVALGESVTVAAGTFTGCVAIRDLSVIDPALQERKTYCPGVGLVLIEEGGERIELIERSGL